MYQKEKDLNTVVGEILGCVGIGKCCW
jgi:hypothetical protein